MQIKIFTLPLFDNDLFTDEINSFLSSHKILEVSKELINNSNNGTYWTFCISYIEKENNNSPKKKEKIDYKEVLDEKTFNRFSELRKIRKAIADEKGIPAYAIFTNEELAEISKLEEINKKNMLSIKGIGDKKVEKYADIFITEIKKDKTQ